MMAIDKPAQVGGAVYQQPIEVLPSTSPARRDAEGRTTGIEPVRTRTPGSDMYALNVGARSHQRPSWPDQNTGVIFSKSHGAQRRKCLSAQDTEAKKPALTRKSQR